MTHSPAAGGKPDMKLFWACFIALVATSFVFGVRANTIGKLQDAFDLSEVQKGNINGAGMWPFALSIIFFSLLIDQIGYKTVALFAVVCHVVSLTLTLRATGYESFYWGTFLTAVANGTVESFINPVVATLFPREKAKWLNILHAGWPAGLALGALFCVSDTPLFFNELWKFRFALCFVPVVLYALLIIPVRFPVQERVAAGIGYRDMLREVGGVGFFMLGSLVFAAVMQLCNMSASLPVTLGVGAAVGILAALFTGSAGNWLFIMVLIVIGPLATTELGTDGWMPELLKLSAPKGIDGAKFAAGVFVYISAIMTVLRFGAGPVVEKLSPIGLLCIGAFISVIGLAFLSQAAGYVIVAAATVYAFGKTFLWSTTLGMTSEQFPKGGALTLNGVSAMGVLFLGVIGSPAIGYVQDVAVDKQLSKSQPALYQKVKGEPKPSIFGNSPSLNQEAIKALGADDKQALEVVQNENKKATFLGIAVLPTFMLVCYLGMFFWFKSRGGYKPVSIGHGVEAEPGF
jgi:fucose permease